MADTTGGIDINQLLSSLGAGGGPTVGGVGAGVMDLIRGIKGTDVQQAQTAAAAADPFASQRGQYQTQLQGLLTDPSSFTMDPGTKFAMDQGLEGVARHGNAMFGTTRSGGTAQALESYATGAASQAYNTRIQQLLQMSGANNMYGPMEAGRLIAGGFAGQNSSMAGGLQGGINGILQALFGKGGASAGGAVSGITGLLARLFGGGGGSTDMTGFTTGQNSFGDILNQVTGGDLSSSDPSLSNLLNGNFQNDINSGSGTDYSYLWGGIGDPNAGGGAFDATGGAGYDTSGGNFDFGGTSLGNFDFGGGGGN